MFKRLSEPTGAIEGEKNASDSADKVVRPAILVHAGPERSELEFQSGDGPIKFDEKRVKNIVAVHNARVDKLAQEYGGEDKVPIGAYEPLLDSHERDSNDRIIGRLTGRLKFEIRDVPKVGKNVPCAVAEGITFLGKDTVERVNDGRIYHLSIGINEENDSLGETSTVIKPAAPGAMLLKQGKGGKPNDNGGTTTMGDKLKKLKAHQDRLTKLSAIQMTLGESQKKLTGTSELIRLTSKKAEITHRLKALCSDGKMTPAEFKNLVSADDLTHLAALDEKTLGIALKPYESREKRVIQPGQAGTTDAVEFATLSEGMKKTELKKLRSEIAGDFKRLTGKKLIDGEEEPKDKKDLASVPGAKPVAPGADKGAVPGEGGDEQQLKAHHLELKKHLEAGDVAKAKEVHEKIMGMGMKHMSEYSGDSKSEDYQKSMKDQQTQIDELNTQLARVHGMVEELIGAEKEEGHDLEAGIDPDDKDGKPAAAAS